MYSLLFCISFAGICNPQKITFNDESQCNQAKRELILQLKSQRKEFDYVLCKPGR